MADPARTNPLDLFKVSKDLLAMQQKFMPSGLVYGRIGEAVRGIAEANTAYVKELMRANATLLAAFTQPQAEVNEGRDERDEPPSEACHHSAHTGDE